MEKSFEQIGNGVRRIAVVAVERDNQIAGGAGKSLLVTAAVAAHGLPNDLGAERMRNVGGTVSRAVVDHDDLVDEIGHTSQDALNPLLFIEARNDHRDAVRLVHVSNQ